MYRVLKVIFLDKSLSSQNKISPARNNNSLNLWNCVLASRCGALGMVHQGDRPPGSNPSCFLAVPMMCPAARPSEEDTPVSMLPLPLWTDPSGTLIKINCSFQPLCKALNPSNEKRIDIPFFVYVFLKHTTDTLHGEQQCPPHYRASMWHPQTGTATYLHPE